jgi:large subunit ribosomal protein L9
MKVILLQDNKKLGKKGDIVTVSDGFAFNNLIPQGIAQTATEQVVAQIEREKKKKEQEHATYINEMKKEASKINGKKITIKAQAKGDKLFGSVTQKDIANAINEQHGTAITEDMIVLETPIKELTTCEIMVRYIDNVTASVIMTVSRM